MELKHRYFLFLGLILAFFASGCQNSNSRRSSGAKEASYCSTVRAIANGVTLVGTANYQYFVATYPAGLVDTGNPEKPIRYAEVRVKNSEGEIIQCGETTVTGQFSLQIPKPTRTSTYTVEITSRSDNNFVKASILDSIKYKKPYSIFASRSVTPTSTLVDFGTVTAPRRVSASSPFKNIEGGAFHILDTILDINSALREKITNPLCGSLCSGFTVAPKVRVYWKAGFNPGSYYPRSISYPASFMISDGDLNTDYFGLYILGGLNGNVDNSDTDHFDKCVIIHEYTHFLENTYWQTDTPGGDHSGYATIDPRLALSEGTAYFMPSLVTGQNDCIDTKGTPDGTLDPSLRIQLYIDAEDERQIDVIADTAATTVGEGIYHEYSITRALYDYWDNHVDSMEHNSTLDTAEIPFYYIWSALTNGTLGLKNSSLAFRSMGDLNESLKTILTANDSSLLSGFNTVRLGEFQTDDRSQFAAILSVSANACPVPLNPIQQRTVAASSLYYEDLFVSADYFQYNHPGGNLSLKLEYGLTVPGGIRPNLDLYLFEEGVSTDLAQGEWLGAAAGSASLDSGSELIPLANVPSGKYLVMVYAPSTSHINDPGDEVSYNLNVMVNNGSWSALCP